MTAIEKLTAEFKKWIGYCEKKSCDKLDDKTANAGSHNYTIFARDYKEFSGIDVQGQPWCDCFVDTIFCYAFGVDAAKKMLCGFSAYTPTSANNFKAKGQFYTYPKNGDIVFFKNSTRVCHTGFVYAVDSEKIYTIEGNTSTTAGVVANGGGVAKKSYLLSYAKIAGYGRPKYNIIEEDIDMEELKALRAEVESLKTEFYEFMKFITDKAVATEFTVNTLRPMVYNYIDENMPEWARESVKKAYNKGIVKGTDSGLGLTQTDLKMLVVLDRLELLE